MKRFREFINKHRHSSLTFSAVLAFLVYSIIETLARHSIIETLKFLISSPGVYLLNTIIIFATYSIALLFRRKFFWYTIISVLWLAVGIVNGIILLYRMTPFTTNDVANTTDGLSLLTNYMSDFVLILSGIGAFLVLAGVVLLFIFGPKSKKVNYKQSLLFLLIIAVGTFGATELAIKTKTVDTFFGNLAYAYRDFGVPYCFINTWLNTGIPKPANYSKETVSSVFSKGELGKDGIYKVKKTNVAANYPNIVFLQLESFVDPTSVKGYSYSEDPMPNFRQLLKQCSSGYLTVPSVGAGTANTEFEAITGMSARFFGPGEYPYKSILPEKTFESIPYDLKNLGFSTHAIHNHRGVFYGRNLVFPNLGFDTFTSLEYMNNVAKTAKNWSKDDLLTQQILDALNSTKGKDYIFTISVQGHGQFPTEQLLQEPAIQVTKAADPEQKWAYEYFVNQVYEMDLFVKTLTDVLSQYPEDVVLVMFGDHLPALDMSEEQMKTHNLFQTQYAIWSNFDLPKKDMDLSTYNIGAEVLDRVNIHEGLLTKYHQNYKGTSFYLKHLELLGYDMLYGNAYIYGEKNPFPPVDMKMGVKEIKIDQIVKIGDIYYIKGQNFTEYSKVSLDGKVLDTVYLTPTFLRLKEEVNPEDVSRMKISQVEKSNKQILSTTE